MTVPMGKRAGAAFSILLHPIIRKLAQAPLDLAFTRGGLDQFAQIILKLLDHARRIVSLDERQVFPGLDVQVEQGGRIDSYLDLNKPIWPMDATRSQHIDQGASTGLTPTDADVIIQAEVVCKGNHQHVK